MYHRLLATIVVVSLSFFPPQSRADAPVTLGRDPALGKFRPCVRNCYWGGYGAVGDYVAQAIGCGNTYSNDCFCRIDLQGEAEAYVNSCVNNGCSGNEIDRSPALSFYTDYCTKNGYTRDTGASTTAFSEVSTVSTPAPGLNPTSRTLTSTTTSSRPSQRTSSSTSSSSESPAGTSPESAEKRLGTPEIVGIVVGVLALIVAILTLAVNWKTLKSKMSRAHGAHALNDETNHGTNPSAMHLASQGYHNEWQQEYPSRFPSPGPVRSYSYEMNRYPR